MRRAQNPFKSRADRYAAGLARQHDEHLPRRVPGQLAGGAVQHRRGPCRVPAPPGQRRAAAHQAARQDGRGVRARAAHAGAHGLFPPLWRHGHGALCSHGHSARSQHGEAGGGRADRLPGERLGRSDAGRPHRVHRAPAGRRCGRGRRRRRAPRPARRARAARVQGRALAPAADAEARAARPLAVEQLQEGRRVRRHGRVQGQPLVRARQRAESRERVHRAGRAPA